MKGLLAVVAVIFAGVVGYKVVKKAAPAIIRHVKGAIVDARESFYEGYVNA